jgi:hypothetical protein
MRDSRVGKKPPNVGCASATRLPMRIDKPRAQRGEPTSLQPSRAIRIAMHRAKAYKHDFSKNNERGDL